MPVRGHATAPVFDSSQPRSIQRFFQDLKHLFTLCAVIDEEEKKQWVVRYAPIDEADLFEVLPAYSPGTPYADFKKAVYNLYPGTDDERKWSVADMDQLVGECARLGIHSIADLAGYHRDFLAITTFLISKNRISAAEQGRAFARGFQPALWARILWRLELKDPDHYPDDPYVVDDIHRAATFVLHGTQAGTSPAATSSAPAMATDGTTVKVETIQSLIDAFTRTMQTFVTATSVNAGSSRPAPAPQRTQDSTAHCHYCGDVNCMVGTCRHVEEDMRSGRVCWNSEGKVVLPNGSFVPRSIPGITIRNRVYEWHHRNPGNLATGQGNVSGNLLEISTAGAVDTFQLGVDDRIAALERELLTLRKGKEVFDGVEITTRRRPAGTAPARATTEQAQPTAPATSTPTQPASAPHETSALRRDPPPHIPERSPTPSPTVSREPAPSALATAPARSAPEYPTHPFANARDATYAPPASRNFGAAPKPGAYRDPAYRTLVPIQQPGMADQIFQKSLKTPLITLTPEELLALAPEVRNKFREAITPRRVASAGVAGNMAAISEEDEGGDPRTCSGDPLQEDGVIIPDPYEAVDPGELSQS
ncbi:hypothetical protein WOLCODRAFT_92235 [Wolfiporia cocos MD-104 SS10]|uniref:Uncharacterized protein n=1 Tax=Wolfiporia cocos (strain MD-104) TaxID=742152 RepID=A0A2H3JLX3_WOLCO|nr:hypothetical protein WOLCODRAFT_92235 [Wolfiporia cocos MD-104 SS10]